MGDIEITYQPAAVVRCDECKNPKDRGGYVAIRASRFEDDNLVLCLNCAEMVAKELHALFPAVAQR